VSRALRILLIANDGLSAGHVTRTLAVARALAHRGGARDVGVQLVLATTSDADALLARESLALVRMPSPAAGRRAGLSDAERRRLVRGCIESVVTSFAPDVIVADTFPSGPHGELAGLVGAPAKRVLVRRHTTNEANEALTAGLASYDLAILAADPTSIAPLPCGRCVHVPPIVLGELRSRADARAELSLPPDARVLLVTWGGGGDPDAAARAERLAATIARIAPETRLHLARGPLAGASSGLGPLMAAFDGAIAAAGYNTAHELARAGVPAAFFASPRSFDDQEARARRFEVAGLATRLRADDDDGVAAALAWLANAKTPALECNGAAVAADAILDLATGKRGAP
jgi:predicted glycosyltransferase